MSRTINELNTTDTLVGEDKLVLWQEQSGATRAITAADAADYFSLAGGPYQPSDELLTSIAALGPTTTADRMIYTTAQDVAALTPITAFARTVLDDADAATALGTLGGQPLNARLTSISGLTTQSGDIIEATSATGVRARKFQAATYAALRALSGLTLGDAIYVNGRASLRDGGEGWGTVAGAGTDNDGITIVMADGKAWIRDDIQEAIDADVFGIIPGTVTIANYNTMVATINLQNARTVNLRGGIYVFPSRPATMTTVMRIDGVGESITTVERGYSEGGGATVGFLEWNDSGANNSRLTNMLVRAASGTTGGTMVRFYTTTTSVFSWPELENVVISPESGAYAYAMDVDGILNTTGGSQGIRSLNLSRVQLFAGGGSGTDAARFRNVVNSQFSDIWTNGNILIGGGGTSASNSQRVTVTGFISVGGTLTIENCEYVSVSGTMNNVTVNATAANVTLVGDCQDLTIAAGATGTFSGRVRGTLTDNSGGTFGIYTQTGPRGATAYNGLIELARATVNMNITTDQAVTVRIPPGFTRYALQTGFVANNGSANYATAAGGIYLSASKTTPVVDAAQVYTSITGANKRQTLTINSTGLDLSTDTTLFFSLTTAAGVAGTGDLVLVGYAFT